MFKKQPNFKSSNNIKSSDSKKLNEAIVSNVLLQSELPPLATTEFIIDHKSVQKAQFESTVSKGFVYSVNLKLEGKEDFVKIPTWVEISDMNKDYKLFQFNKSLKNKVKLFPTVYTTWLYQNLIPVVITNSYVLDEIIMVNGSDLSIRGCALPNQYENFYNTPEYVGKLIKGTVVGIADFKQPHFIKAIGLLMEDSDKVGESGMVVTVLHTWNDFLKSIFKVTFEPPNHVKAIAEEETLIESEAKDTATETLIIQQDDEDDGSVLLPKQVDDYLYMSLYYIITQKVKIDFPCSGSNFVSQFILNYLPYDAPIDQIKLKNSTFKKSAKLFKAWEKESLIKVKTLKSGDVQILAILTDVSKVKSNENLRCFITYKTVAESTAKNNKSASSDDNTDFLSAVILYKPKSTEASKLLMSFEDEYFSKAQIKEAVTKYVSENNLIDSENKSRIKVDSCLAKLTKSQANTSIERKEVSGKITNNSSAFTFCLQVYKGPEHKGPIYQQPLKMSLLTSNGSQTEIPPILIKQESFRNKIITRISNLWVYNIDLEQLASVLKLKCNASVTFDELKFPALPSVVNNYGDTNAQYKITSTSKIHIAKTDVLVQGPHEKLITSILKKNNRINVNSATYIKTKNDIKGRRKNASST